MSQFFAVLELEERIRALLLESGREWNEVLDTLWDSRYTLSLLLPQEYRAARQHYERLQAAEQSAHEAILRREQRLESFPGVDAPADGWYWLN
jgi:hypothetical protein